MDDVLHYNSHLECSIFVLFSSVSCSLQLWWPNFPTRIIKVSSNVMDFYFYHFILCKSLCDSFEKKKKKKHYTNCYCCNCEGLHLNSTPTNMSLFFWIESFNNWHYILSLIVPVYIPNQKIVWCLYLFEAAFRCRLAELKRITSLSVSWYNISGINWDSIQMKGFPLTKSSDQ